MKKRTSNKLSDSASAPSRSRRSDNGVKYAAMERVFQLTHGREMTLDERRLFGLPVDDDNASADGHLPHHDDNGL